MKGSQKQGKDWSGQLDNAGPGVCRRFMLGLEQARRQNERADAKPKPAASSAPVGIDTDAEPSAKALTKLIDHLKKVGAGALFVENISSPTLVHQIARETGIKIGGRLFSDALSERGGPATSYEKMFEHNLGTLIAALQKSS